jgi:hypothetical protein
MLADVLPIAANFIPGVGPLVAGGIGAAEGALSLGDYSGGVKGALTGFGSGFGAGEAGLGDMSAGAGGLAGLGSGAGNAAAIPELLSGVSSMGASLAYQNSVNAYNNRVNAGPGNPLSQMSPAEQAAYRGASDSNLSQLVDRREGQIVGDLGSRGLLSSGVGVNQFTALQNWQDNQRAASEAAMYQAGASRAMSIWDRQLQASQFGVGQLGVFASAQQKAFGQAGNNMGANKNAGWGGTPPIGQTGGMGGWTLPAAGINPSGSIFSGPSLGGSGSGYGNFGGGLSPSGGSLWSGSPSGMGMSDMYSGMMGGPD